jgi:RNA-directed DNA polymerase
MDLFTNLQPDTPSTFHVELSDLFEAYYACRKRKRRTINAMKFEWDFETELLQLKEELSNGSYKPGRNIAFIVNKPVKREIFAADFRDRVVHHYLMNKINPLLDERMIADCYACRKGKGTHYGVQRIQSQLECLMRQHQDVYIMKLDIQGFFMSIPRDKLFKVLQNVILKAYKKDDLPLVLDLVKKIVHHAPERNCYRKGSWKDWNGLPNTKSLFYANKNCGLPIGNLTSQVFANFYLSFMDQWMVRQLHGGGYGRYVDDFILMHADHQKLLDLRKKVNTYLMQKWKLELHPKKMYLQHGNKGVAFLGTFILPGRIYTGKRTWQHFYLRVKSMHPNQLQQDYWNKVRTMQSVINSYLGIVKHYKSFRKRKSMLFKHLNGYLWNHLYCSNGIQKVNLRRKRVLLIMNA